jgi:hypothetical protein
MHGTRAVKNAMISAATPAGNHPSLLLVGMVQVRQSQKNMKMTKLKGGCDYLHLHHTDEQKNKLQAIPRFGHIRSLEPENYEVTLFV